MKVMSSQKPFIVCPSDSRLCFAQRSCPKTSKRPSIYLGPSEALFMIASNTAGNLKGVKVTLLFSILSSTPYCRQQSTALLGSFTSHILRKSHHTEGMR